MRFSSLLLPVTICTVFLSALLMFAIQPLTGRLLLPLAGGAPGGWLTALCFFQLALLAGYMMTHLLRHVPARLHVLLTGLGLLAGLGFMPIQISGTPSADIGAVVILGKLAAALAVPFVALSMVSGVLARIVAAAGLGELKAYRLYAASNAGSVLGLLLCPLLLDPLVGLQTQQSLLYGAYILLLGLVALLLGLVVRMVPTPQNSTSATASCNTRQIINWVILAAIPVSLSYGCTQMLVTHFGSLPLLWILPLLLYLVSLIQSFAQITQPGQHSSAAFLLPLSLAALLVALLMLPLSPVGVMLGVLVSFYALALHFHRLLAASRPDAARLTHYYVWLAVGGALAGLVHVLIVPHVLVVPIEYPLVALLAVMLFGKMSGASRWLRGASALALVGLMGWTGVLLAQPDHRYYRNFFGLVQVYDAPGPQGQLWRWLASGDGVDGGQRLTPTPAQVPELYFDLLAPLMTSSVQQVGMVGLGAGIALCYTTPTRQFTVYEIDDKYRTIAADEFSYLKLCGEPRWRMGDGRLLLQQDEAAGYDVLIVDAFHGGQIPLHLISLEALQLYQARVSPHGVIVYNLNSRYYNFVPQLAVQAAATGWQMWRAPQTWVALARYDQDMSALAAAGWHLVPADATPLWRDDHANLLGALRVLGR